MKMIKIILLSCLLVSLNIVAKPLQAFNSEILLKQQQENKGKRWLILLWSVDCPPCYKELALISHLREQHELQPIVIINTDDNDEVHAERSKVITQFKLDDLVNLYFIDGQGAYNRYSIDASWHGELPRSYLIDEQGKAKGRSGLLDKETLLAWLKKP